MKPRVGVGIIIQKDKKILLGKRRNAHGEGEWCFPGGHLEFGESIKECALREVKEETGLLIRNLKIRTFTNDIFNKDKHYITIFVTADYYKGKVEVKEPDKCSEWKWFDRDNLPKPLFLPIRNLIKYNLFPE